MNTLDDIQPRSAIDRLTKELAQKVLDDLEGHPMVKEIDIAESDRDGLLVINIRIYTNSVTVTHMRSNRVAKTGDFDAYIRLHLCGGGLLNYGRTGNRHPHKSCLNTSIGMLARKGRYSDAVWDFTMALSVMDHW